MNLQARRLDALILHLGGEVETEDHPALGKAGGGIDEATDDLLSALISSLDEWLDRDVKDLRHLSPEDIQALNALHDAASRAFAPSIADE